jgi:hypothetical protein
MICNVLPTLWSVNPPAAVTPGRGGPLRALVAGTTTWEEQ